MTTYEQLEAEAAELYPIKKALDVDHTAIVIAHRSAHVRAKTVSAEQVKDAALEIWRDRVGPTGEGAELPAGGYRRRRLMKTARAAFRAAGFYVEGDDE